ncbi:MAG: twin-arginine translocase TatA/TatE family subunit [Thermoguttaceae bacterium]|nr:twin-arginine translocase TatA/TatE family subunit [Thermoguttaceae bacterium]
MGIGTNELLILAVIAVLLFGTRLPTIARSFGQSVTEFKKGMKEIKDDVEEDVDSKDSKKKDEE